MSFFSDKPGGKKSRLCQMYLLGRCCNSEDGCLFAHSKEAFKPVPYKHFQCRLNHTEGKVRREFCVHRHDGETAPRPVVEAMWDIFLDIELQKQLSRALVELGKDALGESLRSFSDFWGDVTGRDAVGKSVDEWEGQHAREYYSI
eukprot:Hpha_TRINITY_DN2345_c0_g1::TRINITY_DN2345_c0_g1_i1::g.333::m.333